MKRFFLWANVSALCVLLLIFYHMQTRTAPGISISLQDEFGWIMTYGLPAVDGYVRHTSLTIVRNGKSCQVEQTDKVISIPGGNYSIVTDYRINRNGVMLKVDQTIPVMNAHSDKAAWTSLDAHLMASAYLNGDVTNY